MKNKTCLIYQPCGLGDILFLQKISYITSKNGYDVVHPVINEYSWLNDYVKNKKITFPSWGDQDSHINGPPLPENVVFPYKEEYWPNKQDFISEEFMYLNFFLPFNGPVMASKYNKFNIDYSDWSKYIGLNFDRNYKKEKELFFDVLDIKENEEYIFVNRNYQMRPDIKTFNRISNNPIHYNNKRVVELNINKDFTMFDWSLVLENAQQIHMIETSLNYIIESDLVNLDSDRQGLFLYSRYGSFNEVEYLFKTKWNYMRGIS